MDRTGSRISPIGPERSAARDGQPSEITQTVDDSGPASIAFVHYDQNIARIERRLGVVANVNGNQIILKGPKEACENARRVLEMLYARAKLGQAASLGDVEGAIAEVALQGSLFPSAADGATSLFRPIKTR